MIPEVRKSVKEALIARLTEFFKPRESVELAYLFGSTAEENRGPLSDIDIGIYISNRLTKKERIDKLLELSAELSVFLKNNNIDLVVMNDSSPFINFEIIQSNVPLFIRDKNLKLDVEQKIMSLFLDRKYHEDLLNRFFLERIQEKGGF